MSDFYDYSGAIHIHSNYSDGLLNIEGIIKAVKQTTCDFIIITDHDNLLAFPYEGYWGNTLLLVGEEITVKDKQGHYLALNLSKKINPEYASQDLINKVMTEGGFGFIAHPFNRKQRKNLFPAVSWLDWEVCGFNGMEIWNYSQDWVENLALSNSIAGFIQPDLFIEGPIQQTLKKWDELLNKQRITGIAGVDAHGYFCSYQQSFRTIHTHIITEKRMSKKNSEYQEDKSLIYRALSQGNCYVSYDYLYPANGFNFLAKSDQHIAMMGEQIPLNKKITLHLNSPYPALLRIIQNGHVICSQDNCTYLTCQYCTPGIYRAEVYLLITQVNQAIFRPWIFSNPIYIL